MPNARGPSRVAQVGSLFRSFLGPQPRDHSVEDLEGESAVKRGGLTIATRVPIANTRRRDELRASVRVHHESTLEGDRPDFEIEPRSNTTVLDDLKVSDMKVGN